MSAKGNIGAKYRGSANPMREMLRSKRNEAGYTLSHPDRSDRTSRMRFTLDSAKLKDLSDVGRALPEERTDREYDEYGDPIVASNGEYATLHDLYPVPEGHGEEVESECDEASDDD